MINQKGGVGKSSTCFHLAGALVECGYEVLLIDADPQGSLSQAFLGSAAVEELLLEQTLAHLFRHPEGLLDPEQLIVSSGVPGLSLVPANHHLAGDNSPHPEQSGVNQFVLQEFLESLQGRQVVLIDCPPNLYQCSWNALLAATHVLIPVPPEDFGTQGLRAIHQAIHQAQVFNPGLRRLGHLITRYDRRLLIHRAYVERLRNLFPELVLENLIPEAVAFKVAVTSRQPVGLYDSRSAAAKSMQALAEELEIRMTTHSKQRVNSTP